MRPLFEIDEIYVIICSPLPVSQDRPPPRTGCPYDISSPRLRQKLLSQDKSSPCFGGSPGIGEDLAEVLTDMQQITLTLIPHEKISVHAQIMKTINRAKTNRNISKWPTGIIIYNSVFIEPIIL